MMSDICWMTFNFHIAVIPVPAGLAACAGDTRCRRVLPIPAVLADCLVRRCNLLHSQRCFSPNHSMPSAPCLSDIAGLRPAGIGRTGMHPTSSSHTVRCAGRRFRQPAANGMVEVQSVSPSSRPMVPHKLRRVDSRHTYHP